MKSIADASFHALLGLALGMMLGSCGNWTGNPLQAKKEDKPEPADEQLLAGTGEAAIHRMKLVGGEPLSIAYSLLGSAGLLASESREPIEISVLKPDGTEEIFQRSQDGVQSVAYTPATDGDYAVLIKNNGLEAQEIRVDTITGALDPGQVIKTIDDPLATHKNILLKAVVVFARQCVANVNGGASAEVRTAPTGEYFLQPFVFLGQVDADTKKVNDLSQATIRIDGAGKSISLKKLADFDYGVFRELSGLSKEQHVVYTKHFYGAYFGAAGEMYTTDTFQKGGDCTAAPTFALPTDVGQESLTLHIVDTSVTPPINSSFSVRPTVSTSFSLYEREGQKISNWDPCTYDTFSAKTINYNTPSLPCRQVSLKDPPFVSLDYKLPSEAEPERFSKLSDPTRILYYGYAQARAFRQAVIEQQDTLRGSQSSVTLERCLTTGGMRAVPLNTQRTYLPLAEFNAEQGDLLKLARRAGSYTSLTAFYQGNISTAGSIAFPTCIPNTATQETCGTFKVLDVAIKSCSVAADSGISATAISDRMIYPDSFDITGELID